MKEKIVQKKNIFSNFSKEFSRLFHLEVTEKHQLRSSVWLHRGLLEGGQMVSIF